MPTERAAEGRPGVTRGSAVEPARSPRELDRARPGRPAQRLRQGQPDGRTRSRSLAARDARARRRMAAGRAASAGLSSAGPAPWPWPRSSSLWSSVPGSTAASRRHPGRLPRQPLLSARPASPRPGRHHRHSPPRRPARARLRAQRACAASRGRSSQGPRPPHRGRLLLRSFQTLIATAPASSRARPRPFCVPPRPLRQRADILGFEEAVLERLGGLPGIETVGPHGLSPSPQQRESPRGRGAARTGRSSGTTQSWCSAITSGRRHPRPFRTAVRAARRGGRAAGLIISGEPRARVLAGPGRHRQAPALWFGERPWSHRGGSSATFKDGRLEERANPHTYTRFGRRATESRLPPSITSWRARTASRVPPGRHPRDGDPRSPGGGDLRCSIGT